MGFVFEAFVYRSGVTDANTRADEAFAQRVGVCQDFAHVNADCAKCTARLRTGYYRRLSQRKGEAAKYPESGSTR